MADAVLPPEPRVGHRPVSVHRVSGGDDEPGEGSETGVPRGRAACAPPASGASLMWLRTDDHAYDNPKLRAVRQKQRGALEAVWMMWGYACAQRTNGWIPTWKAKELATAREIRALRTIKATGRAPLLHEIGDECSCLEDKNWPDEDGYWAHDFLDRNPSKAENDVQRAKNRELKDKELKHAVRQRDGDACRYCGATVKWADRKSGAGGVFDHVDPTIVAGADNLVVACRSCNGRKRDCTPAAAGMMLLPPTGAADSATITPQPGVPEPMPDLRQIHARSTPDQPPITDPTQIRPRSAPGSNPDPDSDPDPDPPPAENPPPARTAVTAAPDPAISAQVTGATSRPMTSGTGRGGAPGDTATDRSLRDQVGDAGPSGHRRTIGPATTLRDALNPPPYRKATTANAPPIGPPPREPP